MFFSINAYKIPLESVYRLKNDFKWEPQENFKDIDLKKDMIFFNHEDAENWLNDRKIIMINGEKVNVYGTEVRYLANDDFYIEIVVHRNLKPNIFTKNELKKILKEGDDRYNNSLIIDFEGNVKLVQSNPEDVISHANYAVVNKVYNSGNGFVGRDFDDSYIELIYLNLLDNWVLHLETGRSIYMNYCEDNIDEKKVFNRINELIINYEYEERCYEKVKYIF